MRKLTKREQKLVAKRDKMLKELSSEFFKDFIDAYVAEAEGQDGYEYWNDMNTENLRKDMVLYAEWGKVGAPAETELSEYIFTSRFDTLSELIESDLKAGGWISTHKKEAVDMLKALIATIETAEKKEE